MSRNILIMQNLGILHYDRDYIETFSLLLISFCLQRCCYQAISGHIPANLFYGCIIWVKSERIPLI